MSIVETAIKVAEMQTNFDKIKSRLDVLLDLTMIYAENIPGTPSLPLTL